MGAHTLGRMALKNSGYHGPWVLQDGRTTFTNAYYQNLISDNAVFNGVVSDFYFTVEEIASYADTQISPQLRVFSASSALSFKRSQLRAFSASSVLSFERSQLRAFSASSVLIFGCPHNSQFLPLCRGNLRTRLYILELLGATFTKTKSQD